MRSRAPYKSKVSRAKQSYFAQMSIPQLRQQTAIKLSELRRSGWKGGASGAKGRRTHTQAVKLHELGEVRHQIAVKGRAFQAPLRRGSSERLVRDCLGCIRRA